MRVVFFSFYGAIGRRVLEWMLDNTDEEFVGVVSRVGEQGDTIQQLAFERYLPFYRPQGNINAPEFIEVLRKLQPDLFISMYFGRLFSPDLLGVPKKGCINMHPSMLPKGRGQGPSTWPIVNGDSESGQTIHYLDEGIDSGDIIAQRSVPIDPDDNSSTLGRKLVDVGVELFKDTWPLISAGTAPRIPQNDDEATYTVAARREHARINWNESAEYLSRFCRAFEVGGGAWARVAGKRLYVWKATPYKGAASLGGGALPGQLIGVVGSGLVVQTGGGPLVLSKTEVSKGGPDLMSFLGGALVSPVILG